MPRPLREPSHRRTVRPLSPTTIQRKLAGDDKVDEETLRAQAHGDLAKDTEDKLDELHRVTALEAHYKQRREALRDEITPELEEGPRIFVDAESGAKYFAYNQVAEDTEVDVELLRQLVDEEVFAEVVSDKVDLKRFRTAVAAGRISGDVLVKVTRFKPKKAFVRFKQYAQ